MGVCSGMGVSLEPDGMVVRRSSMTRFWLRPALPLAVCALLAGCGTQTVTPSGDHTAAAVSSTPRAAARADATSLLAAFVPPPGATRLSREPSPLPVPLSNPGVGLPVSPDLVLLTRWWSYPGTPQQVLAWIRAHSPSGTVEGADALGGSADPTGSVSYDRPSNTQVAQRSLEITFDRIGTRTVLRTDAVVMWLPTRPEGATIPNSVTRITVVATPGGQLGLRTRRTVALPTVTDTPVIAKIVTLLNALPMIGDGATSCGADIGASLRMSFYSGSGTTPAAVAVAQVGGCDGVDLSVRGGPQGVGLDGRTDVTSKVLSLIGATFPPPVTHPAG